MLLVTSPHAYAQVIYAVAINANGVELFVKINLNTCAICSLAPPTPNVGNFAFAILPDGSQLHIQNNLKRLSAPPDLDLIWEGNGYWWEGGVLAPNGLVYLSTTEFGVYDPADNSVTVIGDWPNGIVTVYELFYINGVLYGLARDTNNQYIWIQVNVNDPSQSTILGSFPASATAEGGIWNGTAGVFYVQSNIGDIVFYDPQTGTTELICDIPSNFIILGLSFSPAPEFDCICTTDAGSISTPDQTLCAGETLNFVNTGGFLENGDLKAYILFTNPNDTLGSIVATNSTPTFDFEPPLQAGVAYYFAAMAGNNLNGSVDLNDPCLDFSNANMVIWNPLPTVVLSVGNGDVCPGNCIDVTATFTGTAPFTLTYTAPGLGPVTQTFPSNTGSFQVCVPANAPSGGLVVEATSLADGFCSCQ